MTLRGASCRHGWRRWRTAAQDPAPETSTVSDDLWQELTARFDDAQVLELLIRAGWYHVIAFVCNAAAVEHEEWAERFPPATAPAAHELRG